MNGDDRWLRVGTANCIDYREIVSLSLAFFCRSQTRCVYMFAFVGCLGNLKGGTSRDPNRKKDKRELAETTGGKDLETGGTDGTDGTDEIRTQFFVRRVVTLPGGRSAYTKSEAEDT